MEQPEETAALRELAERLLGALIPFGARNPERPQIYVGAVPPDLPLEISVPEGGRIVGSLLHERGAAPGRFAAGPVADVVLDVPGEAEEVYEVYDREFGRLGWPAPPGGKIPRFGGFEVSRLPPSRSYCQSTSGPWASVRVLSTEGGISDVRIHVDGSGPGPCAAPAHIPPGAGLLPPLSAPPGVLMEPLSGGGGSGVWSSTALATTTVGCVELEAHFFRQFETDGWIQRERGSNGPLAWSTWSSPSYEGWQAVLLVAEEPGENKRLLHARAELSSRSVGGA
ncbi:MAG TPA: hypothetical protein VK821_02050, partial [Dehalococcoidia bacterium]|nr:hypothetical protein [Dehalococcoidia bacterium]